MGRLKCPDTGQFTFSPAFRFVRRSSMIAYTTTSKNRYLSTSSASKCASARCAAISSASPPYSLIRTLAARQASRLAITYRCFRLLDGIIIPALANAIDLSGLCGKFVSRITSKGHRLAEMVDGQHPFRENPRERRFLWIHHLHLLRAPATAPLQRQGRKTKSALRRFSCLSSSTARRSYSEAKPNIVAWSPASDMLRALSRSPCAVSRIPSGEFLARSIALLSATFSFVRRSISIALSRGVMISGGSCDGPVNGEGNKSEHDSRRNDDRWDDPRGHESGSFRPWKCSAAYSGHAPKNQPPLGRSLPLRFHRGKHGRALPRGDWISND